MDTLDHDQDMQTIVPQTMRNITRLLCSFSSSVLRAWFVTKSSNSSRRFMISSRCDSVSRIAIEAWLDRGVLMLQASPSEHPRSFDESAGSVRVYWIGDGNRVAKPRIEGGLEKPKESECKLLSSSGLRIMGRGGIEPPTRRFSVYCSTN